MKPSQAPNPRPSNLEKSTPSVALRSPCPGLTRALRPGGGNARRKISRARRSVGTWHSKSNLLACALWFNTQRPTQKTMLPPDASLWRQSAFRVWKAAYPASPGLVEYVPCTMYALLWCNCSPLRSGWKAQEGDLTCQANTMARDGQLITAVEEGSSSDHSIMRRPHNTEDWTRQRRPRLPCPRRVINCGQGHERQSWTHAGVGK